MSNALSPLILTLLLSIATLSTINAQAQTTVNLVDTPTLLLPGQPKTPGQKTRPPRPRPSYCSPRRLSLLHPAPAGVEPIPVILPRSITKIRHSHHDTPDTDTPSNAPHPTTIVGFYKRLYASAGTENTTALVEHFRPAFDELNQDGMLGDTLNIIYDMRLNDLQTSVKHARKMKEIVDLLAA